MVAESVSNQVWVIFVLFPDVSVASAAKRPRGDLIFRLGLPSPELAERARLQALRHLNEPEPSSNRLSHLAGCST